MERLRRTHINNNNTLVYNCTSMCAERKVVFPFECAARSFVGNVFLVRVRD